MAQPREAVTNKPDKFAGAVTALNVGRVDQHEQHQTGRIFNDMMLAPLVTVIALLVTWRTPLVTWSALLVTWSTPPVTLRTPLVTLNTPLSP